MKTGAWLTLAVAGTAAAALAYDPAPPAPVAASADEARAGTRGPGLLESEALPPGHPPIGETPGHGEALPPGHPPMAGDDGLPPGHPPIEAAAAASSAERVEPLRDGQTVAAILRDAKQLEGKKVRLRARVTKVTTGVLGKNWLHLQDGTGDPQRGDHDLVVTTQATPALGDIVELEGTVVCDKDLGSGYRYDVLVENAAIR